MRWSIGPYIETVNRSLPSLTLTPGFTLKTPAYAVEPADAVEVVDVTEDAADAEVAEAAEEEDSTGNSTTMATSVTSPEIVFFQKEDHTSTLRRT